MNTTLSALSEKLKVFKGRMLKTKLGSLYSRSSVSGQILSLGIVVLLFTLGTAGKFIRMDNIQTVLGLAGIPIILCLAIHQVIILGAMDLSVEGIVALTAVSAGMLLKNNLTPYHVGNWIFPIVIIIGGLAGLVNGLLNTRLKMPSFISTLGVSWALFGFAILVSNGTSIALSTSRYQGLVINNFLGMPVIFIIALALAAVLYFVQHKTKLGKHMYAIGGTELLARQAGVKVERVKIIIFTVTGMNYGLAGLFLVARLNSSSARLGNNLLFPPMTAVAVGGVSLSGGIGGALNAVLGTLIVVALNNGLVLMQVNPYAQSAVNGIVLIAAVALTIDRNKIGIIK
jgi:ribose/xylose/arabinose/galactoside ABC-type transport system permease subunit